MRFNSGGMTAVYSKRFGEYVPFKYSKLATAALGNFPCWRAEENSIEPRAKNPAPIA